jgi:heptosyltransferase-2
MTRSPGSNPKPVRTGRYRYSKLRWRVLVHALDLMGAVMMLAWRRFRPIRPVENPKRILIVQLDHLGDSVLTSPLIAQLKLAYPAATIDVMASPSNHEVFEADPAVDRVMVAERTWFERQPQQWGFLRAVWNLGRAIRSEKYDLGIDVRGDVLTVLVLTLGGIPRRVGWAMGGGGFLLTDLAEWVRGRHEVRSRLALLVPLGITPDESARALVHVPDEDRGTVARWLSEAWPRKNTRRIEVPVGAGWTSRHHRNESHRTPPAMLSRVLPEDPERLHAGRFGALPPMLAVHLGAGTAAKRWPRRHWSTLIQKFLDEGWRVVIVGGPTDPPASQDLPNHDRLRDWTGRLTVTQTTALLERADLFIGADSGPAHLAASTGTLSVILFSGTNQTAQWRPWSRYSLILRQRVPCQPCHQKTCPLADHPCMTSLEPDRVYRAAKRWWSRVHHAESPHAPISI